MFCQDIILLAHMTKVVERTFCNCYINDYKSRYFQFHIHHRCFVLMSHPDRTRPSIFKCMSCGYINNTDVVGAINALRVCSTRLACGKKLLEIVDIGDNSLQVQGSSTVTA